MERRGINNPRRPHWLKISLPKGENYTQVKKILAEGHLFTVCSSARCPNVAECWGRGTATFMILGNICTRNCRFCAVESGKPVDVDPDEPQKIARAIKVLGLSYAVVTSVTRDDLPDGGAGHFAKTIHTIHRDVPDCRIEVLIPDFLGDRKALDTVLNAGPDVLNHNIETIPELYSVVRPQAQFDRSLDVLSYAAQNGALTKSGLMIGLGESVAQIKSTMRILQKTGCRILTIGQYLQPSTRHLPVQKYYHPREFSELEKIGKAMGYDHVAAGPLVRSSFHADEQFFDSLPDAESKPMEL
ncbi:lipoyl synthase [candidate division KSB1 bacterium]|nr:lipoyl synthase [candidate division KSB1 bacterium]